MYERPAGVLRARGHGNWIFACDLEPAELDAVIDREASFFQKLGEEVEWKVYGYEQSRDLAMRLAARGFIADESETLMFLDLANRVSQPVPKGIEIRHVFSLDGLHDLIRASSEAFGEDQSPMLDELKTVILGSAPLGFACVAYADGRPVASGRMDCPKGYSFASIWGGCTIPDFRNRGIFRALVSARADLAARRGHSHLSVDARETSRPILEKLGFKPVTTITGWKLPGRTG